MGTSKYETHNMPHPMLPFIYHPLFSLPKYKITPNWHENIEILQAISGSGYVLCGIEKIPLTPEGLVIINADVLHNIETDTNLQFRCLIIDNSFFTANGVPIHSLHFQSLITDTPVHTLFDRIAQAYEQLDPDDYRSVLDIRSHVLNLVNVLCMNHTIHKTNDPANAYVKKAVIYLRQHLAEPLSLDMLADELGISKFHLAHLFKLYTGKTIVQTMNLIRCSEAQRMIEEGATVSAAAISCGFENPSYFTRTFKKYMGTLPSSRISR